VFFAPADPSSLRSVLLELNRCYKTPGSGCVGDGTYATVAIVAARPTDSVGVSVAALPDNGTCLEAAVDEHTRVSANDSTDEAGRSWNSGTLPGGFIPFWCDSAA
jgi:hypothetical protein